VTRHVHIPAGSRHILGDLTVPASACGAVLFAHGSGSGRLSTRNQQVAGSLNQQRLATLLIDLLTEDEEEEDRFRGHLRFDIGLLVDRLCAATRWLMSDSETGMYRLGYFGASTGAAAALGACVEFPHEVAAVVSRGGRPDLAGDALPDVKAATLLIVGSLDEVVLDLNRQAHDRMNCNRDLVVVSGASHLFQEAGKLEEVAHLAGGWFKRHLCPA
jgi:putative phosphoribosyl transferase